jgi:hypothetical protein
MDRATVFGTVGWGFDSLLVHLQRRALLRFKLLREVCHRPWSQRPCCRPIRGIVHPAAGSPARSRCRSVEAVDRESELHKLLRSSLSSRPAEANWLQGVLDRSGNRSRSDLLRDGNAYHPCLLTSDAWIRSFLRPDLVVLGVEDASSSAVSPNGIRTAALLLERDFH